MTLLTELYNTCYLPNVGPVCAVQVTTINADQPMDTVTQEIRASLDA